MKSYIKKQNNKTYLFFETGAGEEIDKVAAGMLENNNVSGMLSFSFVQFDDKCVVKYDISNLTPVSEYLNECMKKEKIISVIDTILEVYSDAENYLIEPQSIILDCDRIFLNREDDSIKLAVMPVLNKNFGNPELGVFLKNLICRVKFDSTENCDYIGKMLGYLNSSKDFSLSDFRYIVYEQKNADMDNIISDDQDENIIYETEEDITESDTINTDSEVPAFVLKKPQTGKKDPESSFRLPLDFYADDEDEAEENEIKKSLFSKIFKENKNKNKSRKKESENNGKVQVQYCDKNGEVVDETEYSNGTMIIGRESKKKSFLLRLKNNERIFLNGDSLRIGTEKKSVDYCIKDNCAVSRVHAEIIHKDDSYYLVDNDSTNHTFLNEQKIKSKYEMKLQNKSRIRLADEEFIFYS